jgi:hypothetical protein
VDVQLGMPLKTLEQLECALFNKSKQECFAVKQDEDVTMTTGIEEELKMGQSL